VVRTICIFYSSLVDGILFIIWKLAVVSIVGFRPSIGRTSCRPWQVLRVTRGMEAGSHHLRLKGEYC
jgi:hypothetical protein